MKAMFKNIFNILLGGIVVTAGVGLLGYGLIGFVGWLRGWGFTLDMVPNLYGPIIILLLILIYNKK